MSDALVFPELVSGRNDDFVATPWTIEPGASRRGLASCDFRARVLTVPLGSSELDRVVRAHELTHLRVSPHDVNPSSNAPDASSRALECAEELRVNTLLTRLGFATNLLVDGSERLAGERVTEAGDWAEAVYFYVALHGTGAANDYLRGVRKVNGEWAKSLRVVGRELDVTLTSCATSTMSSTQRHDAGSLPAGYEHVTLRLARLADRAASARAPQSTTDRSLLKRSLAPGGRRPPSGAFAPLVLDGSLTYRAAPMGSTGRRPRPSSYGLTARHLDRLHTDPSRRVFARRRPARGGVVVVDQSGSMDIPEADLDELLRALPGATVVGYSHRPGNAANSTNAWLLADRGRRADAFPSGNVGNGVDGPALRFALARRQPGEKVVWVTDGQVTDSNDHPCEALSRECAGLVRRGGIVMAATVAEAVLVLRGHTRPRNPQDFGRVGRALATGA